MAASNETPATPNPPPEPSRAGRAVQRLTPSKSTLYVIGVAVLVSVALVVVASIGLGILATRQVYFEQRNLRELDRIATELETTREGLAQTATLHFVPQQLHFSLSRQVECLIATTQIMGARQQPITIVYYFTDPQGTARISEWYAAQTPQRLAAGSATPPALVPRALPADICAYQRPIGLGLDSETVSIRGGRIRLELTSPLRNLLWPMTSWPSSGIAPDPSSCTEAGNATTPPTAPVTSLPAFVRECLVRAAIEDLFEHNSAAGHSYAYRPPEQIRPVIEQSIDAAFRSNTVRINVSTPTAALDLDSALEIFDAVQIIGTDPANHDRPVLLHQAGRVPAAIEGSQTDQAGVLSAITGLALPGAAGAPGAGAGQPSGQPARRGDFLAESQIIRTGDLILFQRAVPSLAGLPCNPCRIVGIVERGKFDQKVRKLDGVQATIFLISILTLIGLIPLLQLKLRKRLDATGRAGQYLIWLSLTLLAASASVSLLAIWSAAASRNAGALYAQRSIRQIGDRFAAELDRSLELVSEVGSELDVNDVVFPSPRTLPLPSHLDHQRSFIPTAQLYRTEQTLSTAWDNDSPAAIIDTISLFRGDGFADRNTARVAFGRLPGFGLSIGDRPYFNRARNRGFDRIPATGCDFILDRVLARADGSPRVVFMLPVKRRCLSSAAAAAAAPARTATGEAAAVPSFSEDLREFYDPTRQEFVVASGTLRSFLGLALRPGFSYAVIDPHRPQDEANVLFHSRPDAELVERFQREIDDPARFDTLVAQALADTNRPRSETVGAGIDRHPTEFRLDTNYRAAPSRLTVARLQENMDWILVIIEDRDDAAFAVWRASTFGYAIWFICAFILALILIIGHGRSSLAVDRRPGLSLWPRQRLAQFTPPLIARHAAMKRRIQKGAIKRDRHIWCAFWACLVALPSAEGGSRVLFALAAATIALSARSYFQGLTTTDAARARRRDFWFTMLGAALLGAALIAFLFAMQMDYELRRFVAHRHSLIDWTVKLRIVGFLIGLGLLGKCVIAALAHTADAPPKLPKTAGRWPRFRHWLQSWGPRKRLRNPRSAGRGRRFFNRLRGWGSHGPRADVGWILALIILGGVPAAAGFLDSYDQDRYLVYERTEQARARAAEDRRREIGVIDRARLAKLPRSLIEQFIDAPAAPESGAPSRPDIRSCVTLSCLAMRYLDLREQALEYSDFHAFRMADAFSGARGSARAAGGLLLLLPLAALVLILLFFRREYFRPAPLLSPGQDPNFDPPLSLTREQFTRHAVVAAATGEAPNLPFRPAGGNLHLILGLGLDIRDDWVDPEKTARLGTLPTIQWIDLLDPPKELKADRPAIVIGNLDLALQVSDQASVKHTFKIISEISNALDDPQSGARHVFLLADIDPLDRIALLWERHGRNDSTSAVEDWRWAALIQDFTLYPIRGGRPVPEDPTDDRVLRRIREELEVLDTAFAHELCSRLLAQMGTPEARAHHDGSDEEADRMVSFITEQMSDHYYKLWASSSDEERVMLYRVACDCHLQMRDSRGLRSLLTRGLLIRVPEYRLMNRSFTRYVARVGATSNIQDRAQEIGGLDRVWPLLRYPLAAAAGAAVLLLQFVAPSAAGGAVGALPALLALLPTMLGKFFQGRAGAT